MKNLDNESTHESLNRYLDGDLSGEEAVKLASALTTDADLRQEVNALRAVRAAVRSNASQMISPEAENSRLRTLARLRATVETEQWQSEAQKKSKPSLGIFIAAWRPALTTLVTAATIIGVYLALPQPTPTIQTGRPVSGSTAALPNEEEMSLLLDLHDAHGNIYTGEEALVHRSRVAEAQASLLKRADEAVAQHL